MHADHDNLTYELERERIDQLVDDLEESVGDVVNREAVAAMLESRGVRDIDAQKEYGCNDIFDLADAVFKKLKHRRLRQRIEGRSNGKGKLRAQSVIKRVLTFLKYYGYGLLFTMPLFSQIIAILFFEYSLWAWLDFNEAQATIVAMGTISAFIITGGFSLAIGREISHYKSLDNYYLASYMSRYLFIAGILALFGFWFLIYTVNAMIPFYPHQMLGIGGIYMVLIGIWLLASAVLYALRQHLTILISVLIGTVVVILLMNTTLIGIYWAHWIGLSTANLLMIGYSFLFFRIKFRSGQFTEDQKKPRLEAKYYNNYRYFMYGMLYFLFLFSDRLLAWSTGETPPAYIIWFDTPYELGMDWALISLVLIIASVEYSINNFSKLLFPIEQKAVLSQLAEFRNYFKNYYARQLSILFAVGMISIVLNYILVSSLEVYQHQIEEIRQFFASPITTEVFWYGSVSYLFMSIGLLNALFFFTLGRPRNILYSLIIATVVNILVGFICSRMIAYQYAVVGLLAGSVTFAAITSYFMRDCLHNLDYYFYSSY